MKKLNNMKVQPRLILCFILVVLMASISGITSAFLLVNTDSKYSNALVVNGFAQGDIGAFNTFLNKGAALVRDVIMLTDENDIKDAQTELAEMDEQTALYLKQLKVNCNTDAELAYIKVVDDNYPAYLKIREQVVALGLKNQNDEALALFRNEAKPILNEVMQAAADLSDLNVTLGEDVSADLTRQSIITVIIIVVIIIAAIICSIIFAIYIAKAFADPIKQVQEASAKLADGMLDIDIHVDTLDEIGDMSRSFAKAAGMIRTYINDLSQGLKQIASGNFDISSDIEFKGDFIALDQAMKDISSSLSETLREINEASDQVALGATQMAENAQNLAEGATNQAGAVEELTATIENVTATAADSAQKANSAYSQARECESIAESSNSEMQQLTEAMERINNTSKEIENIIAEIEDIASQTNLLSLNASIEAARAGEAGKGFAVVADQIGKLAADSAKSAVNTRELIGKSIDEINNGNEITSRTAQTLEKVIEGIKMLAENAQETSTVSTSQAETMQQIEQGVEQISEVVQNNSASAQETSATSEELSAQSENLKALVSQFQLKD